MRLFKPVVLIPCIIATSALASNARVDTAADWSTTSYNLKLITPFQEEYPTDLSEKGCRRKFERRADIVEIKSAKGEVVAHVAVRPSAIVCPKTLSSFGIKLY
jgi:hypothetical protein